MIRDVMRRAGVDPLSSALGEVLLEYASVDGAHNATYQSDGRRTKGVPSLVSALGSAQSDDEKETALRALRDYIATHGDNELNAHLEQVSPAFRNFILEQLSERLVFETAEKDEYESTASTMAERLRNLRSRLHSNEAHSAAPTSELVARSVSKIPEVNSSSVIASSSQSVGTTSASSASSRQSLRERLAAAQENRKNSAVQPEMTSTSGSARAAALRARLQAVKQQAINSSTK